ncbi:MAG: hypothetical protein U0163_14925 [Gemmatimonadaceae bacterium]
MSLAALLTGCGGSDSGTGPSRGPAGSYALRQIDGTAPPVEIHHGPWFDATNHHFYNQFVLQVTDGVLELDGTANFSLQFNMQYVGDGQPGQTSLMVQGSYTINGASVQLLPNQGGVIEARLQNNIVTIGIDFMKKGASLDYTFRR